MEKGFKFEKLIIWQKAMDFGVGIDSLSKKFPASELYNLSSQIRRAADSVALNISELEFNQFYEDAFSLMNIMTAFKKKIQ